MSSYKRPYTDDSDTDEEVGFKKIKSEHDHYEGVGPRRWDVFCWKCRYRSNGQVRCSKCPVTFHTACIPDNDRDKPNWMCPECVSLKTENSGPNVNDVKEILKLAMERISLNHGVFKLPSEYLKSALLLNSHKITLENIMEKTRNGLYENNAAFLLDFKWMLHNCCVVQKNLDKDSNDITKAGWANTVKAANSLFLKCQTEIEEIEWCGDCYIKRGIGSNMDWFKDVCSEPHLIVWAKYKTFPYWPAKLMKIREKGPYPLLVYFFNDHNFAKVGYSKCLLYSEENPNADLITDTNKNKLQKAIEEANAHISNLEKEFGPFRYAYEKTFVEKQKLNQYLDQMLPGYRNHEKRVSVPSASSATETTTPTNDANMAEEKQYYLPKEIKEGLLLCREMIYLYKDENEHLMEDRARWMEEKARLNTKLMENAQRDVTRRRELEHEISTLKGQMAFHRQNCPNMWKN